MSKRRDELEKAYLETTYIVLTNREKLKFRIGETSKTLNALLVKNSAESFAFITAFNPRSEVLAEKENRMRQKELEKLLLDEGFKFLEGFGGEESKDWKPEKSVFIFELPLEKAVQIGRRFEQNAIVYGENGEEIKLIWCFED